MARFTIYSKDGAVRYSGNPQFNGSYMGVDYLEFRSISSPAPIDWERGDFVDYYRTGLRYRLYSIPEPGKVARRGEYGGSFEYSNVQFHAATKELEIAPFRDLVPKDNRIHFSTRPEVSTYEDVYGIARRIQECMNDLFPNRWRIEVVETEDESLLSLLHEVKEYSVSNGTCLDALAQIYELWKNVGWIHTYDAVNDVDVITIGRANIRDNENTSDVFAYGKGNGLTSIKKLAANKDEFATRLYVYGSDRNIQTRYYNSKDIIDKDSVDIRNLMLPIESWGKTDGLPDARKAFLQADDAIVAKYGLIPRTVYFDGSEREEIYPSIIGLTESNVRTAMIESGEGGSSLLPPDTDERIDKVLGCSQPYDNGDRDSVEATPTFLLAIRQLGFDLHEQGKLTDAGHAVISMKSGDCAGREFVVKSFDGNYRYPNIVLERYWDDSLGMGFPNGIYRIEPEDEFVILDIPMPEYYIAINEDRLLEAGKKLLADYTRVSAFYEPGINPIKIKESGKPLYPGMYMQVYDEDIIDTEDKTDYVLIDTLNIDEASELPQYKVTLREEKRAARTYSVLEGMIEDAKEVTKEDVKQVKQFAERRFRSAQETLAMLQSAFKNFSNGINPVTVQTMGLLVGDESLQFQFISTVGTNVTPINIGLNYKSETKTLKVNRQSRLMHMTLGINSITAPSSRGFDDYKRWAMPAWESGVLNDAEKSYYFYARVPVDGTSGEFLLSETSIGMNDKSGYYHLLIGILNAEYADTREFVSLYGFTEILPGQITTDVIRSADGETYFDLSQGEIGGAIHLKAGSKGLDNIIDEITIGGQNLLRNSGFTGDYLSERLADDIVLDATSQMENNPLAYWNGSENVNVVADSQSASGFAVYMTEGSALRQTLHTPTIGNESYVFTIKAKGEAIMTLVAGGGRYSFAVTSAGEYGKYKVSLMASVASSEFSVTAEGNVSVCELQLERGTVATSWSNSPFDNSSDRSYYQALKYLSDALKGTTTIDGGLVLTNTLKLGNGSNDSAFVEMAGANGIHIDEDSPAFWAGGTMAQAIELISRVRNGEGDLSGLVDFVVTHGGMAVLRNLKLFADSGALGGLIVTDRGLTVDTDSEGSIEFTKRGIVARQKDGSFTEMGTCGSQALLVMGKDAAGGQCYPEDNEYKIAAQINAADKGHAIHSLSGLFAGLRPNIRAVYESAALDALDHTVIVDNDAQMTLSLPSSPRTGQTYKIIHRTDKAVTLSSQYVIIDVTQSYSEVSTISGRGVTALTYYDEMWYAELK